MIRCGVAVDFSAGDLTGIGVYGREMLRGLAVLPELALTAYYTRDGVPSQMCGLPGLCETAVPRWPLPTTLRKSLYYATHAVECDIVHETVQMGFLLPTRIPFKKVVTVFDIAPLRFPAMYPAYKAAFYRAAMRRSLLNADAVLTDSVHCREDIQRTYGFDTRFMDKFTVTPLAADTRFTPGTPDPAVVRKYGMEQPTFLFVGMLSPHKNLDRVLDAFSALMREQPRVRLLVAGKRGWQDATLVARLQDMAPSVQWTGALTQDELAHLYRSAAALVFPSLYEGFGMPVIEAQACGCPVITSAGIATEETAGGAAVLVQPEQTDTIAAAMRRVLTEAPLREELIVRGRENAARYSWRNTVDLTVDVYRSLAGRD